MIFVIYSHVYLLMSTTHLLIKNFLLLNSTSMAFNISIDLIICGNIYGFTPSLFS